MTTGVATRRKETPVIQLHQERLRLLPLPVLQKKERLHTFQFDLCWISVWNAVYYFERSRFICISWCAAHAVLSAACQTIYRKNDVPMIFKNEIHKRIFEAEYQKLCKQDARTLAALYLLTAKHSLWISAKIISARQSGLAEQSPLEISLRMGMPFRKRSRNRRLPKGMNYLTAKWSRAELSGSSCRLWPQLGLALDRTGDAPCYDWTGRSLHRAGDQSCGTAR